MNRQTPPPTIDVRTALERIEQLSEKLVDNGHYIVTEGDQWFLSALAGMDRGASWTQTRLARASKQAAERVGRLRPGWMQRKGPRQRVQDLLQAEMKRAGLEVDPQEFRNFSTRIGTLIELVLSGEIDIDDIGFEQDAESCPLERYPDDGGAGGVEDRADDRDHHRSDGGGR